MPLIRHIINILTNSQSTYIRQFFLLSEEIIQENKEAQSNIAYLKILKQPCFELSESLSPSEISQHLTKIIQLFRVIWLNSPYLKSIEKIIQLFDCLSNQVIKCCTGFINLKEIFQGHTRKNMKILEQCIDACREYIKLYDRVSSFFILFFFNKYLFYSFFTFKSFLKHFVEFYFYAINIYFIYEFKKKILNNYQFFLGFT